MEIDVIACGESALNYKNTGNLTVGVNDCYKIYPVKHLVVIDAISRFSRQRLITIGNSTPSKFYSQLNEWDNVLRSVFIPITFANGSGNFNQFYTGKYTYSNNSAFVAVVLAHKLGANQINLYGADFNTHPNFTDANNLKKTLNEFNYLNKILAENNCKLRVTKESKLSNFIQTI